MRIPAEKNLHSQTFRFDRVEFVWVFTDPNGGIRQFILGVIKDEGSYMESGNIDSVGNYISEPNWAPNVKLDRFYGSSIWSDQNPPPIYNNLIMVEELIELVVECQDYLK
jgi:hypothetical protein